MKFVRYADGQGARSGLLTAEGLVDAHDLMPSLHEVAPPGNVLPLLLEGLALVSRLEHLLSKAVFVRQPVRLLSPIVDPPKIVCLWVNYLGEGEAAPSSQPIFFSKFGSALIGPEETIRIPRVARNVAAEAELAVVIGTGGKHIAVDDAMLHVAGYTIANDVTSFNHRLVDMMGSRGPNMMAKSFDTFAPLGPSITTPDAVKDPQDLMIRLWRNGKLEIEGSTSQMLTGVAAFISYLSEFCTLESGDVLLTGSPKPLGPLKFLEPGDMVKIEIDGLGVLANPVGNDASPCT